MRTRLYLNNRLLPALVGLLAILYFADPYRGWLVMLTGLGGMLFSGLIWTITLRKNLSLIHERRYGWAQVGDRLEERFVLRNSGWLPAVWVDVDYHTTMPGYLAGRAIGVPAGGEISWATGGICTKRGVFSLGPLKLYSGDPLGVFGVEISYPATATLLVTPPVIPLPKFNIVPGGRTGEGRVRQPAYSTSVNVSTVREYTPGDSFRLIHWPTTVRRGDYYVRILENMPAGDWWIFLDLDARHKSGEDFVSTEEHGVILAASLAETGLRQGRSVGLVTQGEGLTWLPPQFGETQHQEIMHALALAESGAISLTALLAHARPAFRQNPSLILITSNLEPEWIAELQPLVKRRIIPTVLLFDPARYTGLESGRSRLPDLVNRLETLGIPHLEMEPSYFDRPEARPGSQGRWLWRRTSSSRAVPDSKPGNLPWQKV